MMKSGESMENVLGVMTNRLTNRDLFRAFHAVATEEGFDDLLIFTPDGVDVKRKRISGYTVRNGELVKKVAGYPAISYDIGYYSHPRTVAQVRKIKQSPAIPFINYGLGNKWTIHRKLSMFSELRPHLIPTVPIRDTRHVRQLLEKYGTLMLKPINGKKGKGIVRLSKLGGGYLLEKEVQKIAVPTAAQLSRRVGSLLGKGKYIGQKWIDIHNREGIPFDIRSLVQKNRQGEWRLVGMAVRQGEKGKVTSNLMDGGTPYSVLPYLQNLFGKKQSRLLYEQLVKLSLAIPPCLELAYQRPQADLGIDLAIDKAGHLYIIEVNIKPGKLPLKDVIGLEKREDVIRLPVQYAGYCLRRGSRGTSPIAIPASGVPAAKDELPSIEESAYRDGEMARKTKKRRV
ncbi:MAG: YheC/YheD family protein [Brevibacillus sp.]|nr:YheC/YheD family protein [Brevibacillus sp.]